jgi:hypothetical protein
MLYFDAEVRRLELIYRSSSMKAEELSRRADEKAK